MRQPRDNNDEITIFGGNDSNPDDVPTVPSGAELTPDTNESDTELIDTTNSSGPSTVSEYISQRALSEGFAQVDHFATEKFHEHQQAKRDLYAAREARADERTIHKLEHRVNFLQMFLNELRRDGFFPFEPSLMSDKEIDREIQKIRTRLVDDFHSYDKPRDRQTLAMLEAAKAERTPPAKPADSHRESTSSTVAETMG